MSPEREEPSRTGGLRRRWITVPHTNLLAAAFTGGSSFHKLFFVLWWVLLTQTNPRMMALSPNGESYKITLNLCSHYIQIIVTSSHLHCYPLAYAPIMPCMGHCNSLPYLTYPYLKLQTVSNLGYSQEWQLELSCYTYWALDLPKPLIPISRISEWEVKPFQCPAKPHTIWAPSYPLSSPHCSLSSRSTDLPGPLCP